LGRDSLLPDTLEETPEETRMYATLLEIDKNATRKKMHDGDYHHPFHKPNIAEDGKIIFTYTINKFGDLYSAFPALKGGSRR
jgi:hypothetical protein